MTTKNNGLDEMFFEQYEALTDEELAEVNGGGYVLINRLPNSVIDGLYAASVIAEGLTSWFED